MEQAVEEAVELSGEEPVDHYIVYVFHEGQWHVWDEGPDLLVVIASLEQLVDEYICECKLIQITPEGEELEIMDRMSPELGQRPSESAQADGAEADVDAAQVDAAQAAVSDGAGAAAP